MVLWKQRERERDGESTIRRQGHNPTQQKGEEIGTELWLTLVLGQRRGGGGGSFDFYDNQL